MTRELIAHPDFERRDTSTLKNLGGGGAQLQPDLVEKPSTTKVERRARPGTGYGMTETCGIITAIARRLLRRQAGERRARDCPDLRGEGASTPTARDGPAGRDR